ncbi:hypothetical protein DUNSADRAFT_1553 [Dunaliella salina]|uniref:Uncharacterized protein n=1 Tax=Dunaliella salina TaxID=3046 RepID=A0ABQ7FXB3_DUNSA|nr:hypothetical protein DUNSADRAFT_1553 [Dunaliella salina]|eukprot:KAF5826991.1 hypothetical protein DUNSADRAFT_1553 [Dunaliella salina]
MTSRSTIAERIAKFRSAPPAPRHARETSAEPKQFWWQTAAGGSRKHLRGAGEDVMVGELGSRDQDASATKRRSIVGPSDRGRDMPGGNGRDQGASSGSASSIRPPTSSTASASAAARSSSRNTLPVTASLSASLSRGPTSAGAPMSRGTLAPTTASSIAAGPDKSGGHVLGGMPEGAGREGAAGEALQALDQLARTNPSLYAALSAIDESPPTPDGDLSEDMLARIQALLGTPSSSLGAAVGGGGGGRMTHPSPGMSGQGHKMRAGSAGPGGLTPVREADEEDWEGEESLQAALNR